MESTEEMNFDGWDNQQPKKELNLSEMDQLVKNMVNAKAERDKQKDVLAQFQEKYDQAEKNVLDALQAAGKKNYSVDGVGLVMLAKTYAVQTPKTIEDKRALFLYIAKKYGNDTLTSKLSINYQSLNSFYNEEAQAAKEEGQAFFNLPGVGAPVEDVGVRFRAKKS